MAGLAFLKKFATVFAMVIILAVTFSFVNVFSNTASAPYFEDDAFISVTLALLESLPPLSRDPVYYEEPDFPESAGHGDDGREKNENEEAEADESYLTPEIVEYVTISLNPSDIHLGSLLLVNHEHSFEIPEQGELIDISGAKTPAYTISGTSMMLSATVIEPLNNMMDAFYAETGLGNIVIRSAFRDYWWQQQIVEDYIALVGPREAARWASLPGHSEHHTGLAVDLGVLAGGEVGVFIATGINSWFMDNSWRYGFVLRYPADKTEITGIAYEPWHFRYVGAPHAYIMTQNNWCLEEYIEKAAEHTQNEPYITGYDDSEYEVYFTPDFEIALPLDCEFDISGNNIDGFIVTVSRIAPVLIHNS